MDRYVLYHPEHGVYLGNFLGLGFWSSLDSAGQTRAVGFRSEGEAADYRSLLMPDLNEARPVNVPGLGDITESDCVAAGLPRWK